MRIAELPIPTYYGDEICRVNGLKYAWDVTKAVLVARSQQLGLFYDRRFDCAAAGAENAHYGPSSITPARIPRRSSVIPPGARVLDLGCAGGYVGAMLRQQRSCRVTGVDKFPLGPGVELDAFVLHDLNDGLPPLNIGRLRLRPPARRDRAPRVPGNVRRTAARGAEARAGDEAAREHREHRILHQPADAARSASSTTASAAFST